MRSSSSDDSFEKFVVDLSLDMRTSLNTIIGRSRMALTTEAGSLTDSQREHLEAIQQSAQHLLVFNYDLVDVARLKMGRLSFNIEEINPSPLIAEVILNTKKRSPAQSIKFQNDLEPERSTISSDPTRLKQILLNILFFIGDSTSVVLNVQQDETNTLPMIQFNLTCSGWNLDQYNENLVNLLSQSDPLPLLNTDFYALFIAKSLVNLQGGRLWVDVPAKGISTIHFTLPVSQPN